MVTATREHGASARRCGVSGPGRPGSCSLAQGSEDRVTVPQDSQRRCRTEGRRPGSRRRRGPPGGRSCSALRGRRDSAWWRAAALLQVAVLGRAVALRAPAMPEPSGLTSGHRTVRFSPVTRSWAPMPLDDSGLRFVYGMYMAALRTALGPVPELLTGPGRERGV